LPAGSTVITAIISGFDTETRLPSILYSFEPSASSACSFKPKKPNCRDSYLLYAITKTKRGIQEKKKHTKRCGRESVSETYFENDAKLVAWQQGTEQIKGMLVAFFFFLTVEFTQL